MEKQYTRVTSILDPFSGYNRVDPVILQRAKDRGEIVHQNIQTFIELGVLDTECKHLGYLDSFMKFWDEKPRKVILQEHRFYNDEFLLTGQCDLILDDDVDGLTLIDWKTSSAENQTWPLQGAAYKWIASEYPINKVIFIKLDKGGEYPRIFNYEYDNNIKLFFDCYYMHDRFFKNQLEIETELL